LLRPGSTIAICCWPKHQSLLPTSCSGSCTRCSASCERHEEVRPRLTHLLHSELHWLDVADRVTYKLGVTMYKCLHGQARDYLSELCTPVAQVAERQHLRFASRHLLVVPRFHLDTYSRRTFAVAGPTTWNLFQNICVSRTCKLTVFVVH